MAQVHPTAVVESGARLAADVEVGAHAFVGPEVELSSGVILLPHAVVTGRTQIGERTRVHSFAALGSSPQNRSFEGEAMGLAIGSNNVIRENVTIHVGTAEGGGRTRIGNDNYLMNGAHVGHDCQVGSGCVIASFSGLAGHVTVEDHAVLGAYTGVHQFARVGESAMSASNAKLSRNAPPFSLVAGDRARLMGLNHVGLARRGFSRPTRDALRHAFHLLFRSKLLLALAIERTRDELGSVPEVERLVEFLETSERGFCR